MCGVYSGGESTEDMMIESFAGVVAGLGLFIVGIATLTANLKILASRRLRRAAMRWTANRFSALVWGALAGGVTQSMAAVTFIVVSILRSGLVTTRGALALMLGASAGATTLVLVVTLDAKAIALYVLGIAGAVMVSERTIRYRPVAASLFGAAMLVLGLFMLQDAAAPLAQEPWFRDMMQHTGDSLVLAFLVATLLTALVQSSSAVSVVTISMATVNVISIDQAIMAIYGSYAGSAVILYLLSANLGGHSRQVAMYTVIYNCAICALFVPLLYVELAFDIPLAKAAALSVGLDLDQQLALVYVSLGVIPIAPLLFALGPSARVLARLYPTSQSDELARPRYIHDQASVDVESALLLADLEQKRVLKNLSMFFDAVRRGEKVGPLREAVQKVLEEISDFLHDLQNAHPTQSVEVRNTVLNRQKLITWLEESLGALCESLAEDPDKPLPAPLARLHTSIRESVDGVILALSDAMESNDELSWDIARQLSADRSQLMGRIRAHYLDSEPALDKVHMIRVLLTTNTVEEVFFVLEKIEKEFNPQSRNGEHVPGA